MLYFSWGLCYNALSKLLTAKDGEARMMQEYYFGNAKWVGAADRSRGTFSVLRGRFYADAPKRVMLNAIGLGFFKCYINGVCINPDTFLPLSSDFEVGDEGVATNAPAGQVLSGHRIYVPEFDITPFVTDGENVIAIQYGGGWYTFRDRVYGLPKAIYRIAVEGDTTQYYISDEACKIGQSFVEEYDFTSFERHNYTAWQEHTGKNFDDSQWENAVIVESVDTEYCTTDCPKDALIEELDVTRVGKGECGVVYDCGQNTVGCSVLKICAKQGELVQVLFSEELTPDGQIDKSHAHGQKFSVVSDGKDRVVQPEFTWFGFRCMEVIGDAEVVCVKVIHAEVGVSSTFECDNETLNWTYKTFLHTMLCNMHTGHPSDCPHLERRGYTGDGQLTCHAALSALDAKAFYEKWMQDIADGQDTISGHVQYTAPFIRSGGGPGGWGCAIVEVPYQLYKHYGDKAVLEKYYGNMLKYIDYMEAHSEFGLVTSDEKGYWCLGDWCGPIVLYPDKGIYSHRQQILIPAPMVNTYFMVKSLRTVSRIASIIGRDDDIDALEQKAEHHFKAMQAAYFNTFDGNFVMNAQGANAYAVDLGLGDGRTYNNLKKYYQCLGCYDTGIFATDILTRVLFERGDADLAVDLLTNDGDQGYEHWRKNGATTLHEYWDSNQSRSHSHPMFGAPVAYFFEYLLGIRQEQESAGYRSVVIEPMATERFGYMKGSINVPCGDICVNYRKQGEVIRFEINIPHGVEARFVYNGEEYSLTEGVNTFEL